MSNQQTDRNPVDVAAEEFVERFRRGEHPSISEYTQRFPEHADEINELLPGVVMMEQLKQQKHVEKQSSSTPHIHDSARQVEQLGDFRIIREIGHGGMGVVYEAEQESLGRRVALKLLSIGKLASEKHLQRFEREAQAAARLHHSNIVPIFGVGAQDGLHYYVMQFIDGRGLDEILHHLTLAKTATSTNQPTGMASSKSAGEPSQSSKADVEAKCQVEPANDLFSAATELIAAAGNSTDDSIIGAGMTEGIDQDSLPTVKLATSDSAAESNSDAISEMQSSMEGASYWSRIANIGAQVADALHYAHGLGILHRDIKPANLLLDQTGHVWITDFGLAKLTEQDDLTRTGDIIGTLRYMAPEQFRGDGEALADQFSLGLTLYEMLAMRPAYNETKRSKLLRQVTQDDPPPLRKLNPNVPRDLETIISKSITREPSQRYKDCGELAADLIAFIEDRPITARRVGFVERTWRWCRRNRLIASLSTIAVCSLITAAICGWAAYVSANQSLDSTLEANARAEKNLSLALEAFGTVFDKVAGRDIVVPAQQDVGDDESEELLPSITTAKELELLQSITEFYNKFTEQNQANQRLSNELARAIRRIGTVQRTLGRHDDAKTYLQRSLDMYVRLQEESSKPTDLDLEIASNFNELGATLRMLNDLHGARESHEQAIKLLEEKKSRSARHELARTHNYFGNLYARRGQPEPPIQRPPRPGEGGRGGMPGMPGRRGFVRPGAGGGGGFGGPGGGGPGGGFRRGPDGGQSRNGAGQGGRGGAGGEGGRPPHRRHDLERDENSERSHQGQTRRIEKGSEEFIKAMKEAESHHMKALALAKKLVDEEPTNSDYRFTLAQTQRFLTLVQFNLDRPVAAFAANQKAVDLLRALSTEFPTVAAYQYALAEAYAMLEVDMDDWQSIGDVTERLNNAKRIAVQLTQAYPDVPAFPILVARTQRRLIEYLFKNNNATAAVNEHRNMFEELMKMIRRDPSKVRDMRRFYEGFFQKLVRNNNSEAAEEIVRSNIRRLEALKVQEESTDSAELIEIDGRKMLRKDIVRRILSLHYHVLAKVLGTKGDFDGERKAHQQAQKLDPHPRQRPNWMGPRPPFGQNER